MARVRLSPPGPARSPEELLALVRRRGGQLRRRRRLLVASGAAAAAGAVAAALVVVLSGPSPERLRVVGSPPGGSACPTSAFRFSPQSAPPQGGLEAGPALTGNAYARLRSGQSVALYEGPGQSITLTRGIANEAFSVSLYAHGSKPLDEIQVLGSATYYYPPGAGLADGRIPFRYPSGAASVSDPCSRYQLVGKGVAEPALTATAERFQPLNPSPATPTTTNQPPPDTVASGTTAPSAAPSSPAQAVGPAVNPVTSPFNRCPNPAPLPFDAQAAQNALATARAAVPRVYTNVDTAGYQITASGPASAHPQGQTNPGYYMLPYGMCGPTVGARTYVVELYFPAMASQGTDVSHGQLFLSRFPQGWQAWYRYH
jgi:hypothetical protein